ncbi:interleukin-15 [Sceloporus undulatus]|uniref:interleukin-15 n=1 Tax=Sceloporus undulatus TaxID=8520 RepID=UPI001C4C8A27|nr:interleukin-15 [Sceloporus undulatus]
MHVIMNNYFWSSLINESAISIFILCSYLLEVQTSKLFSWGPVIEDLKQIKNHSEIDASLYTADINYPGHCNISVVKCFYLEMKVLSYEAYIGGNEKFYNKVHRVVRSLEAFLKGKQDKEAPQCQECETFEEKQYIEFMKNFETIAKRFNREENLEKVVV